MINSFEGQHRFLSNFFPADVYYDGEWYPSAEHAYQAAKTLDLHTRHLISKLRSAADAKAAGRHVNLRADWEYVKLFVMEDILREKFKDEILRAKLINTRDEELIEGNWWGDRYWGVCRGEGENHLGKLLMKIREEVR